MEVLSHKEITNKLKEIAGWIFNGNDIGKEFPLKDFKSALSFVNDFPITNINNTPFVL